MAWHRAWYLVLAAALGAAVCLLPGIALCCFLGLLLVVGFPAETRRAAAEADESPPGDRRPATDDVPVPDPGRRRPFSNL